MSHNTRMRREEKMDNEIKIFGKKEFGRIRTLEIDGKPYFVASDVAKALGYVNISDAISRHCRWVVKHDIPHPQSPNKTLEVNVIPQGDVVRLASHSELPEAERFESWIYDEVIPDVLNHGMYAVDELLNNPDLLISIAQELKTERERNKVLAANNEYMKPKVLFADAVSASDTSILVRDLAKMLRQNGIEIGEKRLYAWMRGNGYICKGSTMPTQRAMELGLFEIVVRTVERGNGLPIETKTAKVTGKGQVYFVQKFLLT